MTLADQCFCLGDWGTNCYVLHQQDQRDCWIIDAGFEPDVMIQYIQNQNLTPIAVIQTHGHVDHIAGLAQIKKCWPHLPIWIHADEREFLTNPMLNLSIALAEPIVAPQAAELLTHGQVISLNGLDFEIRHTPGHSPGGITLYQQENNLAIVGDALFANSIGRTDFPTSNHEQLINAINEQLMTLPDKTRVLSGHGQETTIGQEKRNNPFLS